MGDSSRLILVRRSFCRGSKLARHGRGRRGRTWGWGVRSKVTHVQSSSVIYGLHINARTRMQQRSSVVQQATQPGLSIIGLRHAWTFRPSRRDGSCSPCTHMETHVAHNQTTKPTYAYTIVTRNYHDKISRPPSDFYVWRDKPAAPTTPL